MKELIKPNELEKELSDKTVESYCELYCTAPPPGQVCNRACSCQSYRNDSIEEEDSILF